MKLLIRSFSNIPSLLKLLIILLVVVRLFAISLPPFKIDAADWQLWATKLVEFGPLRFYSSNFFADYFPFFYLFLWVISLPFTLFFGLSSINSDIFLFYFKLINNLFDILTAIIIFIIVKKYNKKLSLISALIYLINPAIIFNTSVWGQTDSLPTFFLISSIYLLNEKKDILRSFLLAVLSILIKPFILAIIPILFVKTLLTFKRREILTALFTALFLGSLIVFLFFPSSPIIEIYRKFSSSLNTYPYGSINAFNFWGIFGFWKSDSVSYLGFTYKIWGYVIFAVILIITLIPIMKKRKSFSYYLAYVISSFSFFLFLTRIHERHLFPVFALLLISAFIYKSKILFISYIFLSINFLLNLFYSYYYYNFVYLGFRSSLDGVFHLISNHVSQLSALNVFIFFIIFTYYLFSDYFGYVKFKFISKP